MLSDHERETLRELERQFPADPNPAGSWPADQVSHRQFGASGIGLITTVSLLGVIMLMAGSVTGALMFGTAAWLIWWAWLPPNGDTPRPP